jgi:hypothetical protein
VTQLPVERYLQLGLQLGPPRRRDRRRLLTPPELAAAVEAELPVDPRTIVAEAEMHHVIRIATAG